LGTYNPIAFKDQTKEFTANTERVKYWLSVGAQPSDRVAWLFAQVGILPDAPITKSKSLSLPKAVIKAKK
jgi:small subunit ribosomal protein S16